MDPSELQRREMQRQKQREARQRQANGALTKKELKVKLKKSKDLTRQAQAADTAHKKRKTMMSRTTRTSPGKQWREREFKGKGRNYFKKARSTTSADTLLEAKQRRKHDVVVVPIFWRHKPGQEEAVVADAERIKSILAPYCDVWIDRTHKNSPGQKYALWEAIGVIRRIEIGPDDVENKRCVVASSTGSYDSARRITVSSIDRAALVRALKCEVGLEKLPILPDNAEHRQSQDALSDGIIQRWRDAANSVEPTSTRPTKASQHNPTMKIDITAKKSIRLDNSSPSVRNDDELVDQWEKDDDDVGECDD